MDHIADVHDLDIKVRDSKPFIESPNSSKDDVLPGYETSPTDWEKLDEIPSLTTPTCNSELQQQPSTQDNTFRPTTMQPYVQFRKVLGVYHNSTQNPDFRALNLRGDALWEDVMKLATEAQQKYLEKGKKGWRKIGRGFTDNAEAGLPYLKYFNPNLEYVAILFGGLRLVFEAAAKISAKRTKVLDALLQIPDTIIQAEHGVELFPHDSVLRERAETLYFMALAAIEGTISWLEQGSLKKQFQALGLGPLYTRDFEEKLKALEYACRAVEKQVTFLCSGSVVRTKERIDSMSEEMKILTKSAHDTHSKFEDFVNFSQVKDEVNRIWEKFMDATTESAEWRQKTHEKIEAWKSKTDQDLQAYRQEHAKEIQDLKRRNQDLKRLKKKVMEIHQASIKLDPKELLQVLDISAEVPRQDLQRILRASTVVTDSFLAMSFLDSVAFKAWYFPDRSTQWFLEGGVDARTSLRHSPLSLMCSKLVESLQNKEPAVPIYFFCGSHTSQQDPCRGPTGMIKSLIGQVLQLYQVQLNFIPSQRYRVQLEAGNIETLCHCFVELVKQLPMDTILLCIIDGISYFEAREFAIECKYVIGEIQALMDIEDLDPRIKLLVTCPLRSKGLVAQFPPECCSKCGEVPSGGRQQMTEREALMATRRQTRVPENELGLALRRMPPPGALSEESSEFEPEPESDKEEESDEAWT